MRDQPCKDQATGGARRTVPESLARGIDVVLNISLLTVLFIHAIYRTGTLFDNPLSERLQGKHTFLWVLGTFVAWLAWTWSRRPHPETKAACLNILQ
jgi:hypothetical protein